ncbi:MAG: hypothetical protein OEV94_02070 [Deltaproteobacteria bacterium]|nr:hypothetical protein [Deltaproteobacteria bacterium]
MGDSRQDLNRSQPPHEAVLLSKIITEKKSVRVTFLDGEVMTDGLRWHTPYHLGMKNGKVVNKSAIKYWEIVE